MKFYRKGDLKKKNQIVLRHFPFGSDVFSRHLFAITTYGHLSLKNENLFISSFYFRFVTFLVIANKNYAICRQ